MNPQKRFGRIFGISKMNGGSITIIAGIFTLFSLFSGDLISIFVSGLVTCCGILELVGRSKLLKYEDRSSVLLPGSQILLLITIWTYSISKLFTISPESIRNSVSQDILLMLNSLSGSESAIFELVTDVLKMTYITLIIVTAIYQGGLAIYYWRGTRYLLQNPRINSQDT